MIVQTKITAPVGAAIGRPSVGICSDVKQHASAVKISAMSPVGTAQKRHARFECELLSASRRADEQCSPLRVRNVVKSASAKKNITIVTGRDTGNKNY